MISSVKLWYHNHRNGIRISKFVGISVILLIIVWIVDINHPELNNRIPQNLLLSVEVSKGLLSTLAGVFLTVTTFTLTTIMTLLTVYNSSYSPRTLQKFIDKPMVLSLIGVFVGGFFYAVLSLFIMQNLDDSRRVLAGSLGIIYALTSMVYFVRFAQLVIRDIKVENLVEDIYNEAKDLISEEVEQRKKSERYSESDIYDNIKIYSRDTGYLFAIEYDEIMEIIKKYKCELVIAKKIGEYIPKGMFIADLNFKNEGDIPVEEDLKEILKEISDLFVLNKSRNERDDYHNSIKNIVEIGLRAISPGVNDPNTCVNCLGKITDLLALLFTTKNNYIVVKEENEAAIIYSGYSVEEELYLTYYQLIHYGKSDPSVSYAILQGIGILSMVSEKRAIESIRKFASEVYDIFLAAADTEMDKKYLDSVFWNISANSVTDKCE